MKKDCGTESSARQCGVWLRSPPSALVESVVKPRVPHRGFSKILWKPASFAGFHRIGTFHSAPCFGILPTTNSEFPLCQGVSRAVLLASSMTERKSAARKQRTYRPTSLRGDFAFPAGCPRRPCPADDLWANDQLPTDLWDFYTGCDKTRMPRCRICRPAAVECHPDHLSRLTA